MCIVLKKIILYRTVSCKYRIELNRSKAESLQPYVGQPQLHTGKSWNTVNDDILAELA